MVWELLAIWFLVAAVLVWFVRDEKRLASDRLAAQSLRYARARALGQPASLRPPARKSADRPPGLTDVQRKFLEEYNKVRSQS